jgi:hypothetical protein
MSRGGMSCGYTTALIMLHLRVVEVAQKLLERNLAIRSFLKKGHGLKRKLRVAVPRGISAHVSLVKRRSDCLTCWAQGVARWRLPVEGKKS